jgi:pSer/pThr/pTyr-binding forkhead associated (FHA) protein
MVAVPDVVVKTGSLAGRRITIDEEVTLGREGTDLVFEDDGEVSRRHAVVRSLSGRVEIEDLGSTNGTFVNERRIAGPTTLSSDDTVRIGQTILEVEAAPGAEATVVSEIPSDLRNRVPARPDQPKPGIAEEDVPTASLPRRDAVRTAATPTRRRDWRMWAAAIVLIALAIAAFFLFFGGNDFASAANDVCGPYAQRVERLQAPRGPVRGGVERLRRIRASAFDDLRSLDRPEEARRYFAAFSRTQAAISRLANSPGEGNARARRAYSSAAATERRAARELGIDGCAQLAVGL